MSSNSVVNYKHPTSRQIYSALIADNNKKQKMKEEKQPPSAEEKYFESLTLDKRRAYFYEIEELRKSRQAALKVTETINLAYSDLAKERDFYKEKVDGIVSALENILAAS